MSAITDLERAMERNLGVEVIAGTEPDGWLTKLPDNANAQAEIPAKESQ